MARQIIVNFPAVDNNVFLDAANGSATDVITLAIDPADILKGTARLITFTSGDDLSGVNFTITGQDLLGNQLSETIVGPNAGAVTSVNQYSLISSIAADDDYTDLSIGIGLGSIRWIPLNNNITPFQYSIQVTVTGAITYSLTQTVSPLAHYKTWPAQIEYIIDTPTSFAIVAALTNANTNQLYSSENVCMAIGGSVSAGTGSLELIILQSGV